MDIIKVENAGYGEYEDLLFIRDKLKKEAHQWQLEYTSVFGELITAVFQKKIDCIRKKKTIGYYQLAINKGQTISQTELESFLKKEMAEYNRKLQSMIDEHEAAMSREKISPVVVSKIKRLYHKLAKRLHPDINPKTNEIPELKNLWLMVVCAYNANDLEELEDAEVLINRALKQLGLDGDLSIDIVDVSAKIAAVEADIERIKTTEPYQYKYLLDNEDAVAEKKKALEAELKEYEDYEKELDEVMSKLLEGGASFTWVMK